MVEREQQAEVPDLRELLFQLPARVLLDRMPGPVIGITHDGVVAYSNLAAASLLGYAVEGLIGQVLPSLLVGCSLDSGEDCVAILRAVGDGETIDWLHADGFPIYTAVSTPHLLRACDPFLMVYITDVTELHWSLKP